MTISSLSNLGITQKSFFLELNKSMNLWLKRPEHVKGLIEDGVGSVYDAVSVR